MEPFRSVRGGGARARLAPAEASLLRNLVGQVLALVTQDEAADTPPRQFGPSGELSHPTDSAGSADPEELAGLEAMIGQTGLGDPDEIPGSPEDPVLARLLPDGYRDDPEAAGEFRKYTESSLRSVKQQVAQQVLDTLPEEGGRIQLTVEQAQAWLKALNDVRLALGVRLGVTEEFEDQWAKLKPDDPQWPAYEVYAWLGAVQESLVQALT